MIKLLLQAPSPHAVHDTSIQLDCCFHSIEYMRQRAHKAQTSVSHRSPSSVRGQERIRKTNADCMGHMKCGSQPLPLTMWIAVHVDDQYGNVNEMLHACTAHRPPNPQIYCTHCISSGLPPAGAAYGCTGPAYMAAHACRAGLWLHKPTRMFILSLLTSFTFILVSYSIYLTHRFTYTSLYTQIRICCTQPGSRGSLVCRYARQR